MENDALQQYIPSALKGVVNILKPVGMTSSDVVVSVRKIVSNYCGQKIKVGHFGTLDPAAAGVLPIGVGKAVRLFDYYLNKSKKYRACVVFGAETDTLDSFGKLLTDDNSLQSTKIPTEQELLLAMGKFIGKIRQIPPMFSAIKINGRRAYDIARAGKSVEMPTREVEIFDLKLVEYAGSRAVFDVECSAGTYIRTLFYDIAIACGTVSYLSYLIRTVSGNFKIEDSVSLEEFEEQPDKYIKKIESLFDNINFYDLKYDEFKSLCDGKIIKTEAVFKSHGQDCSELFMLTFEDKVVGLACDNEGTVCIKTWLWS